MGRSPPDLIAAVTIEYLALLYLRYECIFAASFTPLTDTATMDRLPPQKPVAVRSRNWRIERLPGLSEEQSQQLKQLGIETTVELLVQTQTPNQQRSLSAQLQLHPHHVQKWRAMADLARIPAVGCQYCGLLLHAGITSPAQLAQMPLYQLHRQLVRLYVAVMQRQDLCPSLEDVAGWINQARQVG